MYAILAINLYVHVMWLPLLAVLCVFAGMFFRSKKLQKARKQVLSLENDMMRCHADLLKLERKLAAAEKAATASSPVVPMNEQPEENKDAAQRKSLK